MNKESLPEVRGEYRFDYNLAHLTWFKVGGNAEVFFKPEDEDDLIKFLKEVDKSMPIYVVGNCSNIIIRDGGVDGVVIKLGRNFATINLDKDGNIVAGGGCLNSSVATFAQQNGRSGLEFLVGIPGTVGGGIRMNAGAYGKEFKEVLMRFRFVYCTDLYHEIESNESLFKYRSCNLSEDLIFTSATFKTTPASPDDIKMRMVGINEKRAATQPVKEKTSGSTFANPEVGKKAWELIDEAGLRGYKIGGAQFSDKHCNFMINTGNAKASDLEELGEYAINKVKEKTGITLKWEIKRIGKHG